MALQTLEPEKLDAARRLMTVAKQQLEQRPAEEISAANEEWKLKNRLLYDFPDTGPLRRELYPCSMAFFNSGAQDDIRAFIAANRIGKSRTLADEVAYHMTGLYPKWWAGRRFNKATTWWAANESWKLVRDINQAELLGPPDRIDMLGTGAIPERLIIGEPDKNPHIKFGYESFRARHVSGGISSLQFKSYEQGAREFAAVKLTGGVWLDECALLEIFSECQMRVANTDGMKSDGKNGIIMWSYTPIGGLTPLLAHLRDLAVNGPELGW